MAKKSPPPAPPTPPVPEEQASADFEAAPPDSAAEAPPEPDVDAATTVAEGEAPPPEPPESPPAPVEEEPGASKPAGGKSEERPTPPPTERLMGAVEAILLASGEALSADKIRDLLGLPSAVYVREAITAIRSRWAAADMAVEIQEVAGGHRVVTRPQYAEYVRRLSRRATADRLSQTLLETLSIVAYKQPVARAEVERIRGVQAGDALRGLLDRRLIKVAGRSDQPGRPLLYATTSRFLEVFGLASLGDLPSAKDLTRL